MVGIRVLGPVEADVDGDVVALGGPRQRAVLARLVSARGEAVSVDRLIDDLWGGEPPVQAITSLQAYVSNLRRLLEPGRPPRAPARVLVTAPPGYAIALPTDALDAWRFERLVAEAGSPTGDVAEARARLMTGLSLWRGAAFGEFTDEPWAAADVARLDELRLQAEEALVGLTLRAGEVAAAVPAADALTRRHPLREEGWRLLALALWGSNRQGDALDTLRRARRGLADELGLDPGPDLTALEEAILRQHREVLYEAIRQPAETGPPPGLPSRRPSAPKPGQEEPPSHRPEGSLSRDVAGPSPSRPAAEPFVGRVDELARLRGGAAEVTAGHGSRIALVSGEPGVGKSTLLGRLRRELTDQGWLSVGGQCPEDTAGAPPAWPWVLALRSLATVSVPPAEVAELLGSPASGGDRAGIDASAGRFRLHRAVVAWLREAIRERRLAIVLDDLHWADGETLALLATVGTELTEAPILLLVGYRAAEVSPELAASLAVLAPRGPLRLPLTGLPATAVGALIAALSHVPVDAATTAALAERTGGNPFYLKETARLLDSEGALVALEKVPEGVRDVLRRRLNRLPQAVIVVLRLAAVAGRETDVDVLIDAADTDEAGVLDALDAGIIVGLLTEPAPGQIRFTHALVRDALVADLSGLRRARMHERLGVALQRLRPDDLPALAHHYHQAASAATASRALDYAVRAAEFAERRYAHDTAAHLLTGALESIERIPATGDGAQPAPDDRDAERVGLLGRLLRAQIRAGAVAAARTTRRRAIDVAETADRDDLLVAAFTGWTEPTPWQSRPYGTVDQPVVTLLTRLLQRSDLTPADRCRLLEALTTELAGEGDPRSRAAATQAVELADELDDPALRMLALTALAREHSAELDWPHRDQVAAKLIALATEHDRPAYRAYGGFTAALSAVVAADAPTLSRLVAEGLDFARAYRMPEVESVGEYAQAMLAHIAGDLAEAERRYADATTQLVRQGSLHAEGFQLVAEATLRIGQGRVGEYAARAEELFDRHGVIVADLLTLALAEAGEMDRARRMRTRAVPLRPDFLFSIFAVLRVMALIAIGDTPAAENMYQVLLPLRDQLPGTASLSLAMRPVAHTLGDLARFLGRPEEAAAHYARAETIANRWGATQWAADARSA
ncbi:MAG TPA: BTAD domain-containing putative transcriptional regulator [Rugosimonospora sp.]